MIFPSDEYAQPVHKSALISITLNLKSLKLKILKQSPIPQKWLNDRFLASKRFIQFHRVLDISFFQHKHAEQVGSCFVEKIAGFFKGFKSIGI